MDDDHFAKERVLVFAVAVSNPVKALFRFEIEDGEDSPRYGRVIHASEAEYETRPDAHEAGAAWAYSHGFRIDMGG